MRGNSTTALCSILIRRFDLKNSEIYWATLSYWTFVFLIIYPNQKHSGLMKAYPINPYK
jgi:hypothetical protein